VPLGASGLLAFAGLRFLAAERVGLAMLFASGFVQPLTEFAVLVFHLGQAANQAVVLTLEGLVLLVQHGQASAQVQQFAVAFLAAETWRTTRGHRGPPQTLFSKKKVDQ
jgi:threonine/homoserine efflux transporter RhtA